MSQGSIASGLVSRAWSAGESPLLRQGLLLVPVLLDVAVLIGWGDATDIGRYYPAGLLLLLGASFFTLWITYVDQPPIALGIAVPLIDLVAIGLMRLTPDGNGLGALAVLPAIWLSIDFRGRGVGLALFGTVAIVSAPAIFYFGVTDVPTWSRSLLLCAVVLMVSASMSAVTGLWQGQAEQAEAQGVRLEKALKEVVANRALNDAIVNTVDVGLVTIDRHGGYTSMNPRHAEFMRLAYPDGHAGQAGQLGYVYAADRVTPLPRTDMPTVRALRGEAFSDHVIWVGKDLPLQRALSVSSCPVFDDQGEFDGAVLVYKDVSDLMSAMRVKDEFVSSVSHELRTPLTSIMGYLDLVLEDDAIDPLTRKQLGVARRNSERLLRLVSDLLFTAQADQGRLLLAPERTDLSSLLAHTVADQEPRALAGGIEVRTDIAAEIVLNVDPTRIGQVLENLVSNAVKYTPPGGVVRVSLREDDEYVAVVVEDTGIGISRVDLSHLFTRFFRSRDAEDRAIQGVGLGLAITKSIVEAHGGRILVESSVGHGSTFEVRLPLTIAHRPDVTEIGRGRAAEARAERSVVDDEDDEEFTGTV